MNRRLVVIGAGPIGLEAALSGIERGFQVTVLERGQIGQSLRGWGPTRFFTPLSMNLSRRMLALLGPSAPPLDALLTGTEMVAKVLEPVSHRPPLEGRIRTGATVLGVARARTLKRELAGNPLRTERPFRILLEQQGVESIFEADFVLDASGNGVPMPLGADGLPCPGERAAEARIIRGLGALDAHLRANTLGTKVVLVGDGHSAANALVMLAAHAAQNTDLRVTWAVRGLNKKPCLEVAADPLPERLRIVNIANGLAMEPPAWLTVERKAQVESIASNLEVSLSGGRRIVADQMIACTGARPDNRIFGELQVQTSPISDGAWGIHRALANLTDCLCVPKLSATDLESGEPGFALIGAKSYGRMSTFLLESGRAQVEQILDRWSSK